MSTAFADLHHGSEPFVLPNAWDVASAVVLADAGFPAIGTTSLGVTAAAGLLDAAGEGADLTIALARTLVARIPVPITVDLEGGYSDDPGSVAALATELAEIGIAGVNLEDGQTDGTLRAAEQQAAIVSAVATAVPDLFVNARTDTYWLKVGSEDERLDETTRRLAAYRDAGASGVFVPGLTDLAQTATVTSTIALPLNVLWSPGADLAALAGAGVARISTGSGLYRHALGAALSAAQCARDGASPATKAVDYHDLQRLLASPVE
jgi:2-methylisocitrate lyase-like PEP mutase family enzyme